MQIDDTLRLDYLLKLLNLGGTNGLMKIAPEVCGDWNRDLIDSCFRQDIKSVRADLQTKLKELGEEKDLVERKMQNIREKLEKLL